MSNLSSQKIFIASKFVLFYVFFVNLQVNHFLRTKNINLKCENISYTYYSAYALMF